jgi:hypothetical protein
MLRMNKKGNDELTGICPTAPWTDCPQCGRGEEHDVPWYGHTPDPLVVHCSSPPGTDDGEKARPTRHRGVQGP